ncbi:MAG: GtrA family protein [Ancrocorticia sp.]
MEATTTIRTASVTTGRAPFVAATTSGRSLVVPRLRVPGFRVFGSGQLSGSDEPSGSDRLRFRPRNWRDFIGSERLRALVPWLKFVASGMSTWVLEMVLFLALQNVIGLVPAVVVARTLASVVNFLINKFVVFGSVSREELRRQAMGYATVAGGLMIVNALGVQALVGLGLPSWLAKTIMDASASIINFTSQRLVIFSK